ncbi:TIMELESS-interacting protein-like [Watersipora subatra]|uniref:TIMELESS-interacting protein-like n=1 Tax=Watersipora subatra TaxID=2589382 RepID=UPI00355BE03A
MESYGLGMDELFDDGDVGQELNDFETVQELNPDAVDGVDGEGNNSQNDEGNISQQVAEKLRQLGAGAAKKRVMKEQPKLDPKRLTGKRGIGILPQLFENVKYKGKGHEVSDLKTMMGVMEHWGHRLFPRMPFDELIERVERLCQKKAVQTFVSKVRLDMPLFDEDFVSQVSDDEAQATDQTTLPDENLERELFGEPECAGILEDDEEAMNEILQEEEISSQNIILSSSTPHPKARPASPPDASDLTEEQLEMIRAKQERAKAIRLNRSTLDSTASGEQMDTSHLSKTTASSETSDRLANTMDTVQSDVDQDSTIPDSPISNT